MLIFFVYECLKTGAETSKQVGNVAKTVANIQEAVTNKPVVVDNEYKKTISKLFGHYGYFCLLGIVSILFYMTFTKLKPYIRFIIHAGIGIIYAFSTEFIAEAKTEGRNASIIDVGIDTLGLLTLSTIFIIVYYIVIINRKKKSDKGCDINGR